MKKFTIMTMLCWVLSSKVMAGLVVLTAHGLGLGVGDQGHSVGIDGAFTVSARTITDTPGGYNNANVWVGSNSGIGAFGGEPPKKGKKKDDALNASKHLHEELIFDFETTVNADSIVLTLSKYDGKHDATTFRLVDAHDASETLISDAEWAHAITFDKANSTVIDLSKLSVGNNGTELASLAVRQTAGSIYVSSIEFTASSGSAEVPEPTTIAMLGAGCLMFVRKRKV